MVFLILPNFEITVPCGHCIMCDKRKFSQFRMRLIYELKEFPNSIFVTLTFDNQHLKIFKDDPNRSIRLFLDRVRKKYGKQVRHWFVAEYGELHNRLHYHGILFDINLSNTDLSSLWKYGFTFVGYANEFTARYIVKYLTKQNSKGQCPPRIISSFGIGKSWLNTAEAYLAKSTLSTSINVNGMLVPIPRYYLDKMYNKREKEIISYYLYMESSFDYYFAGRKYDSEYELKLLRNRAYKQLQCLSLVYKKYHLPRINRDVKTQISFESYFNNVLKNGQFSYSA